MERESQVEERASSTSPRGDSTPRAVCHLPRERLTSEGKLSPNWDFDI